MFKHELEITNIERCLCPLRVRSPLRGREMPPSAENFEGGNSVPQGTTWGDGAPCLNERRFMKRSYFRGVTAAFLAATLALSVTPSEALAQMTYVAGTLDRRRHRVRLRGRRRRRPAPPGHLHDLQCRRLAHLRRPGVRQPGSRQGPRLLLRRVGRRRHRRGHRLLRRPRLPHLC